MEPVAKNVDCAHDIGIGDVRALPIHQNIPNHRRAHLEIRANQIEDVETIHIIKLR